MFSGIWSVTQRIKNQGSHGIAEEPRYLLTLNKAIVQSEEGYAVKNNRGHRIKVFSGAPGYSVEPRVFLYSVQGKAGYHYGVWSEWVSILYVPSHNASN